MVSRVVSVLCVLFFLVSISASVMAMGRRVKPAEQPPSLGVNQPEVELIKPEELPPMPPISEELKENKPQEVSVQLAPDEATKNRQIQTALKNAGYDPGVIDGKIGAKTKTAVKDFQTANGLKADGKVGAKTWAKLSAYILEANTGKGGN
jgi:murein L,D-transpeptidase YcbB/YkuD